MSIHIVSKEDEEGNIYEYGYYCSDLCAKTDPDYAGWYGAVELSDPLMTTMPCEACGHEMAGGKA